MKTKDTKRLKPKAPKQAVNEMCKGAFGITIFKDGDTVDGEKWKEIK